ncbi:MAG: hypothetical protein L0Y80_09770, partial [Ignavibacteriae bacterium]|nr:hypothetical protein [Ignavibacteriota bacterium]
MRRFFRATYYLAGTVFFLTVAIAGFTQTKTFRTYLHAQVEKFLTEELRADIQFGPLEGNLVTGLRIEGITLSSGGEVIIHADRLEAVYEPMGVLIDRVAFSEIKLTNPVVRLVRSRDGSWNIDSLFASSSVPDTSQQPSNLVVSVRNLQLDNAEFVVIDSLKMEAYDTLRAHGIPLGVADYPVLRLHGLKLNASARVDAKGIEAGIQHLSFVSDQPSFALTSLGGEFEFGESGTRVGKLSVETPESRFALDASLDGVDVTKLGTIRELERKPLRATVSVEKLSLTELRRLFPSALEALDKQVAVQARIGGSIDRLHVERMTVRTPRSVVNVEGMLTNLHRAGGLEMDLVSVDSKIDPTELPVYLPKVNLPDMTAMGDLTYNLRFTGKPSAFTVRFEGQSGAGNLIADAALEVKKDTLVYRGKLTTEGINIGALLDDDGLTSSFFSTVIFDGRGTDLQTMSGTIRVELDSSQFYGMKLGPSVVAAEIAGGKLRTHTNITSGATALNLTGTAGFHEGNISSYALNGTVKSFNLASVLKSAHYTSDLSFGIEAEGRGVTFGDMQTKLQLLFGPSTFSEHAFVESKVVADLDALNPAKQTFHLTSDVADIDIEGAFNLDSFIATLYQSGLLIAEAIDHRLGSLVSVRESQDSAVEKRFESTLRSIPQPVDARYTIVVRDFFPIGVFLGYQMAGSGVISGEAVGSLDGLQLQGSAGLDAFVYADNTVSLGAYGVDLSYSIDDVSRVKILDAVHAKVDFSGRRLEVNETIFSTPTLFVDVRGPAGSYELEALIDSAVGVHADGSSLYENGYITYTMDTLIVDVHSYRFVNSAPVTATLGQDGVSIGNLKMKHGNEEVQIAGIFNPNGVSDLNIEVANFLLSNLQLLSANKEYVRDVRALGGSVDATAKFSGLFENPTMSLNLVAQGVRHGETALGQIVARSSYTGRLLDIFVELRNKPEENSLPPDFVLSGFLPYDLALTNRRPEPLTGELNLTMQSRGLRLQLVDPFIGELANLSGTMVCDVAIRGTV